MNSKIINSLITLTLCVFLATNLGCKKKDIKRIGTLVAIGIAAKVIYDMVIEHQTQQVTNEKVVIDNYKKLHKTLPDEPTLVAYQSSIQPGEIVNAGEDVVIVSQLEVVRSASSQTVDIQEKIIIYDNDDNRKEIKSLTKTINQETKRSGAFANEFKFKLPKGMPQGVYPIKTQVIIDGKASQPVENKMQLVFFKSHSDEQLIVAAL